ncbi:MAG: hypothetical protein M1817_006478 [Caeruleum heppii]|nr:MAG: hypothetical protein M1817_006478 [Caeruleum heppii]
MPKRKAKKVTSSSADENSVKPRKTRTNTPKTSDSPPKTPRTHPSLPLQMTTRGASRRASASQSESGHSLISDRRASLDMAVSDAETDKAANAVRLSTEGPQEPGATTTDSSLTERDTPAEQSSDAAPSNKRKRAENPEADASENPDLSIAAPEAEADTEKLPTISVEPVAKKRRGRQPKPPTSPSAAPVTADDGLLDVPQPIVKRGPGRPRGSKKPAGKLTGLSGPRGPGRKRAPHSDPRIEALLVRQGDLRKSYRQVAKAIKPALAELADRCTQDLLEQEEVHKKALEYDVVQKELDVRLDQALAVTERRYQLDRENMMSILEADKVVARKDYTRKVRDLQDDQLAHCKHAFMEVVRSMRIATDEDATDDEDADAGRPRRPDEPFPGTSRSWFFRDVDRRWAELEKQAHMLRSLYACAPSIVLEPLRNLATIDAQQRHVAVAANNVEMLRLAAEAADVTSVARESNPLDLLASAAEDTGARVNKRAVPQTPKTPKRQARPKMGLFLSPAKGRDRAPENGVTASPTTRFEGTSSLSAILNQDEPPPRRPTIVTTQTYGTAAASVKTEESPRRGIMDHRMRAGQVEVTPGSDKKHPPLGSCTSLLLTARLRYITPRQHITALARD